MPVSDEVIRRAGVQFVLLNISIALTWTNQVRLAGFEPATLALGVQSWSERDALTCGNACRERHR